MYICSRETSILQEKYWGNEVSLILYPNHVFLFTRQLRNQRVGCLSLSVCLYLIKNGFKSLMFISSCVLSSLSGPLRSMVEEIQSEESDDDDSSSEEETPIKTNPPNRDSRLVSLKVPPHCVIFFGDIS